MNALPSTLFAECFTAWVEDRREAAPDIVAIDGKTSRRTKARGSHPLRLVPAWASRQRLVLGQQAVDESSNEINAIPLLLARLELEGRWSPSTPSAAGATSRRRSATGATSRASGPEADRQIWRTIRHAALNIIKAMPDKASSS